MARITLRVLDGADRGRVFDALTTPITIGREEGNTIQLNDERVSRFHVKIQEDHDKLVLTDLESTNGTKVNGEDIQLRILRYGDMITIGRSVLLVGSREQIAKRLSEMRREALEKTGRSEGTFQAGGPHEPSLDFELNWDESSGLQSTMISREPPDLPERLSPGQAAQFSEILEYLHIRIRHVLSSAKSETRGERMMIDLRKWQDLLDLQSRLAEYLRQIGEPD